MSELAESLLAQIWNSQWFEQPLTTSDGRKIRVVYPGVWTHGFGPDFRDAMLDVDGRLASGDIEVELDVSGWTDHGHDRNDAFDRVILQVVARDADAGLVRRANGGEVPRVVLTDFIPGALEEFASTANIRPLGAIGFDSCAPLPAEARPDLVREICQRAGDRRMQEKVSAISGEMAVSAPAQVLYARILDALGFSRNREPMAEIAARAPVDQFWMRLDSAATESRFWRAAAMLLGVGGFLPLTPNDAAIGKLQAAQIGRIERIWREIGVPWRGREVSPASWNLARVRPAAHPVRRLLAGAAIFSTAADGLIAHLMSCLTGDRPRQTVQRWIADENPFLGRAHAHELAVNVIIPFALAYGEEADQPASVDAAAELWRQLPAGRGNDVTRRTLRQICGESTIALKSARAEQGLLHINRNGCRRMRCFECPVAHLALRWESDVAAEQERL